MEDIVYEQTYVLGLNEYEISVETVFTTSESEENDVSMFGESSGLANVVLIIEGTSIPVVKSVLSVASPVFKVMFTGDFAEISQKEVELPGKDLKSFLSFLRCIYPDQRDRVTDDTVLSILPLASEYQVANLTAECEECLVNFIRRRIKSKQSVSCDETCKYLNIAERYHLHDLKQLCIRWVANFKLDARVSAFECHEISDDSKTEIFTRACKKHEQYEGDVSLLVTKKYLKEMFTTEIPVYRKPEPIDTKFSKLRIAYKHFGRGSAEYKEQIEKLKPHCVTSFDNSCLQMPEVIIEDLRTDDE